MKYLKLFEQFDFDDEDEDEDEDDIYKLFTVYKENILINVNYFIEFLSKYDININKGDIKVENYSIYFKMDHYIERMSEFTNSLRELDTVYRCGTTSYRNEDDMYYMIEFDYFVKLV